MSVDTGTYQGLGEALDFFEAWLNYWVGLREQRPIKPACISHRDAEQIKHMTQRIAVKA